MKKRLSGKATTKIQPGQHVLCRNMECSPAEPAIANGIARSPQYRAAYAPGDWVEADAVQDQGERDLQALANGPIMDPLRIYLPAGVVSEAEYQRRLDLQFREAGIEL